MLDLFQHDLFDSISHNRTHIFARNTIGKLSLTKMEDSVTFLTRKCFTRKSMSDFQHGLYFLASAEDMCQFFLTRPRDFQGSGKCHGFAGGSHGG